MQFTTPISIPQSPIKIEVDDLLLFVGSCFADNIGNRFAENAFNATVNPFGVMYNPVSIKHTLDKLQNSDFAPTVALFTLGTNHVYREKATGEIVDNCQKRPQKLFQEEILSLEECVEALKQIAIHPLLARAKQIIFTVSPIRYKKYGYHESQLSKATLLLAIDELTRTQKDKDKSVSQKFSASCSINYFPAYEIVLDELRDYRFYSPDMLHPSDQAVDYIFENFRKTYFSPKAIEFYEEYQPIKQALSHKPFNPESAEYKQFLENAKNKLNDFNRKWKESLQQIVN